MRYPHASAVRPTGLSLPWLASAFRSCREHETGVAGEPGQQRRRRVARRPTGERAMLAYEHRAEPHPPRDRKSVVEGKSVSVSVKLGGPRSIQKNKEKLTSS